ncbi:diguanylate phosphodiesterase, partial [Burkholderia thailandensis]|nr:diguanylate phosphodiesterase [Burkholderia thailandensis]
IRRLALRLGQAEGPLAISEARARAALVAVRDAVIFTGPSGRAECMNPAAERLIGKPAADRPGPPPLTRILPALPRRQPRGPSRALASFLRRPSLRFAAARTGRGASLRRASDSLAASPHRSAAPPAAGSSRFCVRRSR